MKFSSKQMIGENLLYLMVWMVIILVPVLNSKMLEEVHVSLENILIAWLKIAPYLLIFIIHNSLIAPRLLLRKHRYVWYLIVNLLTITAVFSLVAIYEKYVPYDSEPYILNGKASFTDLAIYWNILNRVDSDDPYYPDNIISVVTQSAQYHGYDPTNPVLPVLKELALDVIDRWQREKQGETDVGRVLPPEYLFFGGDGKHNTFRTEWDGGEYWDWSWPSPYES